jgi:hypothetical protein
LRAFAGALGLELRELERAVLGELRLLGLRDALLRDELLRAALLRDLLWVRGRDDLDAVEDPLRVRLRA